MNWKHAHCAVAIALLLICTGCAEATTAPAATRPTTMRAAAALRAEDGAVIETALIHFLDDLTVEHFGRIGAKTLLLQDRTVEQAGMIGPDQLSSELKDFAFP